MLLSIIVCFNLEHNVEHYRFNFSTHSHVHSYTPYKVKKSTPSCLTDPKSVAQMQRVYVNFPTGPFPLRLCIMVQYTIDIIHFNILYSHHLVITNFLSIIKK